MEDVLVGIDLGTTFCKAGVLSLDGRELSHARVATPWESVPTGAEIAPERFAEIARAASSEALRQIGPCRIVAIGFTSMAETGVLVDEKGEPLAPAIAWHDQRGDEEAAEIAETFGSSAFTLRTGLPASRLCSLAKLRWLTKRFPELRRAWKWLNVSEWVAFSWGAEPVAELSLATRTGMLDLRAKAWWTEAIDWLGMPLSWLPPLVPAGVLVGRMKPGILPGADGAALSIGGHDHPCAAIGVGVVQSDTLLDSNGTAQALVRAVPPNLADDQILLAVSGGVTVGWHAVPNAWSLLGGVVGGKALSRFLRLLGRTDDQKAELDALALALPDDEPLPRVKGITADFAHLEEIGWNVGPGHVWLAAHKALAEEAGRIRRTMERVAGPLTRVVAIGGWTRSGLVRRVKQHLYGDVSYPSIEEPGVRGAALMAGLAAGLYDNFDSLPSLH